LVFVFFFHSRQISFHFNFNSIGCFRVFQNVEASLGSAQPPSLVCGKGNVQFSHTFLAIVAALAVPSVLGTAETPLASVTSFC
jgi:hypothetical protein